MVTPKVVKVGVTVNGADREFDRFLTLAELLAELGLPDKGVALAVDGVVYPRARWDEPVERGWNIDVVTAVQGG